MTLAGCTMTTAGGTGGTGSKGTYGNGGGTTGGPGYGNNGGNGGWGRIVLEDADGQIQGVTTSTLVPAPGEAGFVNARFDATRFTTGGTESVVTTQPVALGTIMDPSVVILSPLEATDFVAGIPPGSDNGIGSVSLVLEMQGYVTDANGDLDPASATGWFVVGYFTHSGNASAPTWTGDAAPGGFPVDAGVGIGNLDGRAVFVQVRTNFYLNVDMTVSDPGPYVDRMTIRYQADN
jgi:hypothetical protein